MTPRLLLSDDDTILSDLLARCLVCEGLQVTQGFDGHSSMI